MPKKAKKQNLSINTGEPIEEKDLELNPIIAGEERIEDKEDKDPDEDDDLALDEEEVDPFGDKWEQ